MKNLILLIFSASILNAQFLTLRNSTSIYMFESYDSTLAKTLNSRFNNSLYFNYSLSQSNLKGNINVYNDLKSSGSEKIKFKIPSLNYLINFNERNLSFQFGRQFVTTVGTVGTIDGINSSIKLFNKSVVLNSFIGFNVIKSEEELFKSNFKENSLVGTDLQYFPTENIFLRFGYFNKNWRKENYSAKRVDSLFEPIVVTIISNPNAEEYFSVDGTIEENNSAKIYFKTDYNYLSKNFVTNNLFIKYIVSEPLNLSFEYLFREPRLNYNSIFSVFSSNSTQEVETAIDYKFENNIQTFVKYAFVNYIDANSTRLSIGANTGIINFSFTKNIGYEGDLNGITLSGRQPVYEDKINLSLAVGFANYKTSKNSKSLNTSNIMLGANVRQFKNLSFDANLQWMKNDQFKSDTRIFLRASYYLSHSFREQNN